MSIANSYAPIKTSGDGSTDDFSFNFSIYAKSDIKVSWIVKTTGVATVKTLGTHYDVSINLVTEGGIVTFDPAHIPPSTVWVYLESNIPDTQPTNFGVDSKLSEKSVEKMGDRQCRLLQQTNRQLARSLKLPVGSTLPDFLISSIEAGKYLRINQAADGVEMGTPSVTTTDYDGTISAGPDASKPASPSANDIYLATDTKIIYICVAGGVWTQANLSGAFFTALASIPSAAGIIPIANLASGTPTGSKFIRDDGTLQVPPVVTPAFESALLHVRDEKAANTNGGDFTSGAWRTRVLNTVKTNQITGASLASNQITLPAGTYDIYAEAPALKVNAHKAKLVNVTDTADVIIGSNGNGHSGAENGNPSIVSGRFTIASQKVFEIQHQCTTTANSVGFGQLTNFAVVEVYTEVKIWKVA